MNYQSLEICQLSVPLMSPARFSYEYLVLHLFQILSSLLFLEHFLCPLPQRQNQNYSAFSLFPIINSPVPDCRGPRFNFNIFTVHFYVPSKFTHIIYCSRPISFILLCGNLICSHASSFLLCMAIFYDSSFDLIL